MSVRSRLLALSALTLSSHLAVAAGPPDEPEGGNSPPAGQSGVAAKVNGFLKSFAGRLTGQGAPHEAGSVDILDSKLLDLLASNPATSNVNPEWPRIAISDVRLPASLLQAHGEVAFGKSIQMGPGDCFYFKATIWSNETASEVLDKVALCGSDMQKEKRRSNLGQGQLGTHLEFTLPIQGKTTGSVRTVGPTPPNYLLEERIAENESREAALHGYGAARALTILLENFVGFNSNTDTRRFWVVNFANLD